MFYAYSIKQQDTVAAKNVTDLKDTFRCLNEECDAEMFLRSSNGKRQPHFCAKQGKPHIQGCIYGMSRTKYVGDNFIKMPLDEIYRGNSPLAPNSDYESNKRHDSESQRFEYIRTPISLLNFCMAHHLDDVYRDGLTVNDIILNSSNLCDNANFEGISGLKFVVGNTLRYDLAENKIVMEVATTTSHGKHIYLSADVFLSQTQLSKIIEYLLNTYDKRFKGHSIAVLGEWEIVEKYHISCRVQLPKNVVYKFVYDV